MQEIGYVIAKAKLASESLREWMRLKNDFEKNYFIETTKETYRYGGEKGAEILAEAIMDMLQNTNIVEK